MNCPTDNSDADLRCGTMLASPACLSMDEGNGMVSLCFIFNSEPLGRVTFGPCCTVVIFVRAGVSHGRK